MKTPYDKLYSTVKFEKPIIPITACDLEQARKRVGIVYGANNYRQNIYVNRQNWQKKIHSG
ncbi:hypothetical protein [Brochothrix campestris]|uniref:Uncharacterized protein n=1 Tax=Brochothrix campestris FSL F6-1037 TaxID=1265861 RepID=W7D298_9LIST|nr:hypothetical protein [Brochothrix campestris]EUJ39403.1 hypothetical protein BCAMP_07200 [Brochothrix campestris FSL F6-1037]